MGGSFFVGLSGLNANLLGIKTVGNNLANSNTVAYKGNTVFFQELMSAASSENEPGQGVIPGSLQNVWSQGNVQQSQVATDMAIRGDGFFLVGDGVNSEFYTRAGNFKVSPEGKLVTSGGLFVLGYPAIDGKINANANLTPIDISPGKVLEAEATSLIRFNTNLNSETADGDSFSTSTVIFDSLGAAHSVTLKFTKTSSGWDYEMSIPAVETGGAETDPPTVLNSGSLTFDASGKLTSPSADVTGITISGLANGADDVTFDWDLFGEQGESLLTQFNLPSSTSSAFQDGNGAGTLESIIVRDNGIIEGLFSNGETSPLGQIALASFSSPQGLVRAGDGLFARTSQSGEPTVGEAGTGGRGLVQGSALELSNVDIAEEFIKLIIFQRGYQANSRVITTADQLTLEALQLKQ